ncbi:UNVERIFIED_CONTAM: hypothetical protein Sradi_6503500 [Sesamum radiatum]|uniref:RNase H type-1 domain-containing protein n=1 Tax=Sesamum radiatum TaxID=300843 RepID=A0AAW2JV90_SESRA
MEFAIKFDFKASKNEVEYEAVVLGMRMAQDAGALRLLTYSNSQLILKQVSGEYEAKEESVPRAPLNIQAISLSDNDWLTPIIRWIDEGHLPENKWEATKVKAQAIHFLTQGGTLYKKSFTHPLLRCLSQEEGLHVLKEMHDRCCGCHTGNWALANKALRAGYFWPTSRRQPLVSYCTILSFIDEDLLLGSKPHN